MIEVSAELTRGEFNLDAAFQAGSGITALFGPSGSGKTTLLNVIAGLISPSRGRVVANARVLLDTEARIFVPSHQRRTALVFQDAQLFPHMSVAQNLDFGEKFAPEDARRIASEAVLETLAIGHLLSRRPASLSGGERQRVALGRALLAAPAVLLMDEPLASLDQSRKDEILPLIEHVRDAFGIPMIYVTHSAGEARRLASQVIILDQGRVTASGVPATLLSKYT